MKLKNKGFTIVELLVATAIFSVILLVITSGLLQIGRLYFKSITESRTQEVARSILDDVSRAVQFSGGEVKVALPNGVASGWCVGQQRYSYILNQQVTDSPVRHALVTDIPSGTCGQAHAIQATMPTGGSELLNAGMRLKLFSVTRIGTTDLYRITVRVVTGDDDLLDGAQNRCRPDALDGTQFCAVSELSTVVQKRI